MMDQEEQQLKVCQSIIKENIKEYEDKVRRGRQETEELYEAVQSGDTELYNQLIVSLDIQEHNENALRKNRAAVDKPYFGRVDYEDLIHGKIESLYIGKNGISKNRTEIVIVDWRAPVSSLYYENSLGQGCYEVPDSGTIDVDLQLKRTFDIDGGALQGYYDSDVAANDELLVKYLAKNKDVVLGDIISTIQKEQNEIIREKPFTNLIVQGVAGSGKTTVAMHRISYILYNYEKRFAPEEFCIICSNDMLLSYITSGLPELDVNHVGQMRMDVFLQFLLGKEWKKKFKVKDTAKAEAWKSSLDFIRSLEHFLEEVRGREICTEAVKDPALGVLLSKENIQTTLDLNRNSSIQQIFTLLNDRVRSRIRSLSHTDDTDYHKEKLKEYRNYFNWQSGKRSVLSLYQSFLKKYASDHNYQTDDLFADISHGILDVYDMAALALIGHRVTEKKKRDEYSQIIIDEAQDFGVVIYYVLKQVMHGCYFTIMGDVSQNINYETGMNSWDNLRNYVFEPDKESFHILAKSYRNTIEISEYAGRVLDKASAGIYKIQPVIRHGMEVRCLKSEADQMVEKAVEVIGEIRERGYSTTAVICRTAAEALWLEQELSNYLTVENGSETGFQKGVMVLPIQLTKGLEFDTVILWNPNETDYGENEGDAKLLYVAITRALHELHLIYSDKLSKLFE